MVMNLSVSVGKHDILEKSALTLTLHKVPALLITLEV
jgi:hypothetical protein